MNKYTGVFHVAVSMDYDEAYIWYERQQKGLGDDFLLSVNEKLKTILTNPDAFSIKSKRGYREVSLDTFPFTIVYKVYKKQKIVLITSAHHQKKHPRKKYRK